MKGSPQVVGGDAERDDEMGLHPDLLPTPYSLLPADYGSPLTFIPRYATRSPWSWIAT